MYSKVSEVFHFFCDNIGRGGAALRLPLSPKGNGGGNPGFNHFEEQLLKLSFRLEEKMKLDGNNRNVLTLISGCHSFKFIDVKIIYSLWN